MTTAAVLALGLARTSTLNPDLDLDIRDGGHSEDVTRWWMCTYVPTCTALEEHIPVVGAYVCPLNYVFNLRTSSSLANADDTDVCLALAATGRFAAVSP